MLLENRKGLGARGWREAFTEMLSERRLVWLDSARVMVRKVELVLITFSISVIAVALCTSQINTDSPLKSSDASQDQMIIPLFQQYIVNHQELHFTKIPVERSATFTPRKGKVFEQKYKLVRTYSKRLVQLRIDQILENHDTVPTIFGMS